MIRSFFDADGKHVRTVFTDTEQQMDFHPAEPGETYFNFTADEFYSRFISLHLDALEKYFIENK